MNIFKWLFNPDWFTFNMGGGGSSGPNTTYSQTSNIPEYARPYVEQMLGSTQRQLFTGTNDSAGNFVPSGFNNFTPYGSTYQKDTSGNPLRDAQGNLTYTNTAQQQAQAAVAPQSAGQQMATNSINQYVAPSQTGGASAIAGDIAGRSAASGYYSPLRAERFQLGSPDQVYANQVRSDSFTAPFVSQAYMSPYMQNVVNAQQREAMRQSNIAKQQQQAQAVGQGAFGGSRQGIVEAERQRNLATQLGDIQGTGLQQAYGAGQQQFNAEQAAYLQAQQANQQAGLTAQQANQQANLSTGIQNLQSQQQAQAAQEASRQFGAQLGLQGYGQSLQAAQTLGSLGQQQYQQDMGTIQAMAGMGAQEQAQTQNIINQAMQNYGTAQQYPLMQLGVMSNMLRGLPMQSSTSNMYQAQPSAISQLAGAAGTGLGLVQQYNTAFPGKKEGGVVKMAAGGIATGVNPNHLTEELQGPRFNDKALQQKAGDPNTDQATKDLVTAEIARRAGLRAGMANGGIIAFKEGKEIEDVKNRDRIEEEKNKPVKTEMYPVPDRETSSRPITDKTLYNPNEGADEATRNYYKQKDKQLDEIRSEGNRILAKRDLGDMNKGIVAAAKQNVSPVRTASAPTASAPVQDVPAGENQGITAAPQGKAALYGNAGYGGYQEGETSSLDASQMAMLGLTQGMEAEMGEAKAGMNMSIADMVKKKKADREAAGLPPDPSIKERLDLDKRKARGKEDDIQTARSNLAKFLVNIGRTPGPFLRGVVHAGADLIDKADYDRETKKKLLASFDDAEKLIDGSEYLRLLGDEQASQKEKSEFGKRYYQLFHDVNKARLDFALKDKDLQRALETQFAKNEALLAKQTNTPAVIQEVQIKSAALMEKYADAIRSGKITKTQIADMALDDVLSKQSGPMSMAMQTPFKAADLDIKNRLADLEAENLKLKKETGAATTDKTVAETTAKIQENIKKGLRSRENRDAIAEAGEKGYKGKKGDEAEKLKAKDIADKIREDSTRKPAAAPAAAPASVRNAADAILSGGN
jgi:hypothetical protein